MNYRIVQFSDLHIRKGNCQDFCQEAAKIVNVLSSLTKTDMYIFVFCGDIAFSGKREEYLMFQKLISEILKNKDRLERNLEYINFIYVPGNHDLNFNCGIPTSANEFETKYFKNDNHEINDSMIDVINKEYIGACHDFYEFSEKHRTTWTDKIIHQKSLNNDCLNLAMINTTPVSLMTGFGADKGRHHLKDYHLNKLKSIAIENKINIAIMHHGIEWFDDDCRRKMMTVLSKKYSLVLFGHEHDNVSENRKINEQHRYCIFSECLPFYDSNVKENGFKVIDINSETKHVSITSFFRGEELFIRREPIQYTIKNNCTIELNDRFLQWLDNDEDGHNLEKYYCFPELHYEDGVSDINNKLDRKYITDIDELMNYINNKKTIVFGAKRSGKTSFSENRL